MLIKKESNITKLNINKIRELASEGYELGEIADILNISFQVFMQYYNKGKSEKKIKNYIYYRSIYKAFQYGHKDFNRDSK